MSEFGGFTRKAPAFFAGLAADNSKDYYKANEAIFKDEVLAPMKALAAALPASRQPYKLFRLHRDVRFARDKSPYKLWQGALHQRPGGSMNYFHLGADGLLLAAGMHQMSSAQLARFRQAIADEHSGTTLEAVLARLSRAGQDIEGGLEAPLVRVPRGFDPAHPRAQWLKWKGLMCTRRLGTTKIGPKAKLPEQLEAFWQETDALTSWLDEYVGA
ncbi:MAG: DUF2461 domain-containing protein [Burkholderiaceae bacterium]|nr:DUF2461 domain-containing protein [Burkholderiaceae bacterium]